MTISVVLKGRLGNQLFQYATLRSVGLKNNYNITINTNFEWQGQMCLLNNFNIPSILYSNNTRNFIYKYNYNQVGIKDKYNCVNSTFEPNIYNIQDNTLLEGHFENEEFFKQHRQYEKFAPYIKDRLGQPWTDFSSSLSEIKKQKGGFKLTRKGRNINNKRIIQE
jgi:hypothetical protein